MSFGSDGASTMVGSHGGVATNLKNNLNPFILSCHCIIYRINLAALDASKASDCKVISDEVDNILNAIASYFNMSSKRKHALTTLQTILFNAKKTIKRYHKIRWLSRWQAVTILCDSLESVLCFFRDVKDKKDLGQTKVVFAKLKQFKNIYIYIFYIF